MMIAMVLLEGKPIPVLLCFHFSYKNPAKPDGVNYIRTDEEVREPAGVDQERKAHSVQHPISSIGQPDAPRRPDKQQFSPLLLPPPQQLGS